MAPVSVRVTPAFVEALRRIPQEGRRKHIAARVRRFAADAEDPALRLRPFRCAPGYVLIDSARHDRIVLRREAADLYALVDCGGHDIIGEWERFAALGRVPPDREPRRAT